MKVRQPSLQSVLIVTGATAVISFLSIHNYVPRVGFFWNILHGEIYIDAQSKTFEALLKKLRTLVPELLELNGAMPKSGKASYNVVANRREITQAAE